MSDTEDAPELSSHALAALQEFYAEQKMAQDLMSSEGQDSSELPMVAEDWQLSQFWYSDETAEMLAKEALHAAGEKGRIACVSCPTLYHKLRLMLPDSCSAVILEYDKRFASYGKDFIYYDYKNPLALDRSLQEAFDVVVADPPFLSEECLSKTSQTIKFLTKGPIILCTGATMENFAKEILGTHLCKFQPKHARNLANEFQCYANYETKHL